MTTLDFVWQAIVILLLWTGGTTICRAMDSGRAPVSFQTLLKKARHLYFAFPLLLALPSINVYLATHPSLQWDMPEWLQLHWAALSWGIVSGILAYVFGFCSAAALARSPRWRRAPIYFSVAVLAVIQIYAGWSSRPNLPPLGETRVSSDSVILQTTPYTCVPAAGANIAAILGVHASEKEMVKLFHTTRDGTFPAQALHGLRELGIFGRKAKAGIEIGEVTPPAMLFILGDTHAVVYAGTSHGRIEILNPSVGKTWLSESQLRELWDGHALEFMRAAN